MNNGCKPQNIGIIDRLEDHFIITWFSINHLKQNHMNNKMALRLLWSQLTG